MPVAVVSAPFDWTPALTVWAGSALLMAMLWVVAWRQQNANVVDFGWALTLFGAVVGYAVAGDGSVPQRVLIGVCAGVWAGRLTWHLLVDRVVGAPEDGRYRFLRQHFGERADLHFVWFFQAQALLAALLSLPFLVVASDPATAIAPSQWAGVVLFGIGWTIEAVADRQLARWRGDPGHRGRTCRAGLWRFSRHPNYFGEWLMWCAFALLAWPAPGGAWALIAPVVMYVLITRVTGIPYTEAQSLRSRGDDYRRYQREVSAFFPWFTKPSGDAQAVGGRSSG